MIIRKNTLFITISVLVAHFLALTADAAELLASVEEMPSASYAADSLPPAKAGECYGKVRLPATYRTEKVVVEMRSASDRFDILPARFQVRTKRIVIRDALTDYRVVPAELEEQKDQFLVAPARTRWVRDSVNGTIPLSESENRVLSLSGINLTAVGSGTCLFEYHKDEIFEKIPTQVLIREATETLSFIPAKFRQSTESIVEKPAYKRIIEVPSSFRKIDESVMVEAATSVWKKGQGPIQRIDNLTGEIMCRVDVPAVYKNYEKEVVESGALVTVIDEAAVSRVVKVERLEADAIESRTPVAAVFKTMNKLQLKSPGSFYWVEGKPSSSSLEGEPTGRAACRQTIPEQQIAYMREVVKTAGRFEHADLPAVVEQIAVTELVADAASVKVSVPAITDRVSKRTRLTEARYEWRPVLCETNVTNDVVSRLQSELAKEGYSPGGIDGMLGKGTLSAIKQYQKDRDLAQGGITIETIEALGVRM